VGGRLTDTQLGAGAIQDEVERAADRVQLALSGKAEAAAYIAAGQSGKWSDILGLQRNVTVERVLLDVAGEPGDEAAGGKFQLRQGQRLFGPPFALAVQADGVAQSFLDGLVLRRDAGQCALEIIGDAAIGGVRQIES